MAKSSRVKEIEAPTGRLTSREGRQKYRAQRARYNEYQDFLYNRALFGLSIYSPEEQKTISWDKKKRVIKVHNKAQTVINLWKQRIVIALSNHLFKIFFPDSPITKELLEDFGDAVDETYNNKMSFKVLNITKIQIVEKFISAGILPKNFHELLPKKVDVEKHVANNKLSKSKIGREKKELA